MKYFRTRIVSTSTLLALFASTEAEASCSPRDFLVQDVRSMQQSAETELAFVLTSTQEEFENAKKSGAASGGYGLLTGSGSFAQTKERARRIAEAVKFDYSHSYAASYFSQTVSQGALEAYRQCLLNDKESPGLRLWLVQRDGDYFTFNTFWVGSDTKVAVGEYDKEPLVDGAEIVSKPDAFIKGTTEEIVVKRAANNDFFLRLSVDGQTKSVVVVKDPPPVVWRTKAVTSDQQMTAQSFGPNPGCSSGAASSCIQPTEPGGLFMAGSGGLTDKSTTNDGGFSFKFNQDSPDQICIEITQATGACHVVQTGKARVTAIEKYPLPIE